MTQSVGLAIIHSPPWPSVAHPVLERRAVPMLLLVLDVGYQASTIHKRLVSFRQILKSARYLGATGKLGLNAVHQMVLVLSLMGVVRRSHVL
jgi:uncharacterized integral membrane protein